MKMYIEFPADSLLPRDHSSEGEDLPCRTSVRLSGLTPWNITMLILKSFVCKWDQLRLSQNAALSFIVASQ